MLELVLIGAGTEVVLGMVAVGGRRVPWIGSFIYGACVAISAVICLCGLAVLTAGHSVPAQAVILPFGLPWQHAHFRLDALSALFLVIVNLGCGVTSLFAFGHSRHPGRHAPEAIRVLPFYPVFLAAMTLVVLADDAFVFLFSWELMSLVSWLLVLSNHREKGNDHAGFVYLIMAGVGTVALLLAFGLLAGTEGDYTFAAIRSLPHGVTLASSVLALALIGAGGKAGIFPLHVWLPLAHPAAPSYVSALMSGVMTKVAVYGFIRLVFDLAGPAQWWWGALVMVIGGITAVMGVVEALMQHDLKRLLAYHTVENIGIIFIGLGLALAFQASAQPTVAALALTAALLHVFNHSVFKSLLFLGSGAVLWATGNRNMELQGGLIHRMPGTAIAFLIGSAAISALPPLNGFVSEWLILQGLLFGQLLPQWLMKLTVPAVAAMLALSAALAAACFVKAFGIVFLGRPRTEAAATAPETDGVSLTAMFLLAGLCVFTGILPAPILALIEPATWQITRETMAGASDTNWLWLVPTDGLRASYSGLVMLVLIVLSAGALGLVMRRFADHGLRRGPPWDCGFPCSDPATQYTASSFAQPIRRVFGSVLVGAREEISMPEPGDRFPARIEVFLIDYAWIWLYRPPALLVQWLAGWINTMQHQTIRTYLSYMFAVLIVLLMVVMPWR
ncbi:hydrogenase-4 component B [uncultured Gammaproteobacteria bacterium]